MTIEEYVSEQLAIIAKEVKELLEEVKVLTRVNINFNSNVTQAL